MEILEFVFQGIQTVTSKQSIKIVLKATIISLHQRKIYFEWNYIPVIE